jgi:hypothetical protein
MVAAVLNQSLPPVRRLGFDCGWLLLGPTFLNLGRPVLLIDTALLGDAASYGLEPFGTRNPRKPLPGARLLVEVSGHLVGIWATSAPDRDLITIGTFDQPADLSALSFTERVVLMVGDTWAAQQTWSTLWQFAIGTAPVRDRQGRGNPSTP